MLRKIICLYFLSLSRQEPNGTAEMGLIYQVKYWEKLWIVMVN